MKINDLMQELRSEQQDIERKLRYLLNFQVMVMRFKQLRYRLVTSDDEQWKGARIMYMEKWDTDNLEQELNVRETAELLDYSCMLDMDLGELNDLIE